VQKKRLPSGRVATRKKKEKSSLRLCANCGGILHGVPRSSTEMQKFAKSKRLPTRPYAGFLCANCTREIFREKARLI
jgi:large subunit ribosomal protein L34e